MIRLPHILIALLMLFNAQAAAAAGSASAAEVIERLQSTLLTAMKNAGKLGYHGRYKLLKPVIEETHDLPTIAQVAAGRHWPELTDDQRRRFVDAFSDLSVATYAHRFDDYSGHTFRIVAESKSERGDAIVQSELAQPSGKRTRFDYVLRQKDGRWHIINIVANGVSDLAIKRSEYSGILRREGAEVLIEKIRQKVVQHAKAGAAQ